MSYRVTRQSLAPRRGLYIARGLSEKSKPESEFAGHLFAASHAEATNKVRQWLRSQGFDPKRANVYMVLPESTVPESEKPPKDAWLE